jgi:hypothetical protein
MRQNTHLSLTDSSSDGAPFRPSVGFNYFLTDFTREFPVKDTRDRIRPFLMMSLGAVHVSSYTGSVKFVWGIGGGVNVFPKPRLGFRLQVEYLPVVMHLEVQKAICAGGCVVAVNGNFMNQFAVSVGPIFRF